MVDRKCRFEIAAIVVWVAAFMVSPSLASGEEPSAETLAAFRSDPRAFFFEQRSAEAIAGGQVVLQDPDYPPAARTEALTTLGAIYVSTKRVPQARAAFFTSVAVSPVRRFSVPTFMSPQLAEHRVTRSFSRSGSSSG